MSLLQWGVDAPAQGAFKEHEVAEVFKPAGFKSILFQLAKKRKLKSGESLTIPAYDNLTLPDSLELEEDQSIPLSKLTVTAKTISMSERGRSLMITGKIVNRSPFDILQANKDALATMLSQELERTVSTALRTTPIKAVITSASASTITSNGTPSGTRLGDINILHLQNFSNYLEDTLRVPVDSRLGCYVGVFRGNAIYSVQRDDEYFELHRGTGLNSIADLSVGKIAGIQLYKHNDQAVLDNAMGTGNANSEGFIMGDQAVLFGMIEDLGIHYDFSRSKATDFGRFKYIAMVGDYGAGLYSDSANAGLARSMHITE